MASDCRFVIDTGVVISALLLPGSIPRQAFDQAAKQGQLLASIATLAELEEVLRRPKFDRYVAPHERLEFLAGFARQVEIVDVTVIVTDCRDPTDNKFLELAIAGLATHLVSGDADLLILNPFRGVLILTPQSLMESTPA
jgi:hypothetical protein